MMSPANAWRVIADRAQASVANDDEQLVICEALMVLSEIHPRALTKELRALRKLCDAARTRMAAQLEFREILNPEGNGK